MEQAELESAEAAIVRALESRSIDDLNVLGFGELGLAIAWPSENSAFVLKRQAPGTPATVAAGKQRMLDYIEALERRGVSVVPTTVVDIPLARGLRVPYLIQPVLDPAELVENILAAAEPTPNHPVLLAIRDAVVAVVEDSPAGGLSLDAQVSNFVWHHDQLHVLDTTPVLQWAAGSGPLHDVGNYLNAVPAPVRPVAMKMTRKVGEAYRTQHGCFFRAVAYLRRIELEHWTDAAIQCFNEVLDQPIDRAVADAEYAASVKELPNIKRLARAQRHWTETIRRQRYEFFITDSFAGKIH